MAHSVVQQVCDVKLAMASTTLQCNRCWTTWHPRNPDQLPEVCPKCKSRYWNRARRVESKTAEAIYQRAKRSGTLTQEIIDKLRNHRRKVRKLQAKAASTIKDK